MTYIERRKPTPGEFLSSPLPGQMTGYVPNMTGDSDKRAPIEPAIPTPIEKSNVLISSVEGRPGKHKVILDIDLDAILIESSTPGHHHLIIDKEMEWSVYLTLLHALADAGIIERNYVYASEQRGYTSIRLPWITKGENQV